MSKSREYIVRAEEAMRRAFDEQEEKLSLASRKVADAIKAKHNVFVTGCSHAGILAEELFYRTGGLAVINPIFVPGLMLDTRPITVTSAMERVEGVGRAALSKVDLGEGDVIIIHSVSGRNAVPVEMALEAREKGAYVICVTSVAYSEGVTSRHSSGKRLFECADLVIDNYAPSGDAAVSFDGFPEKSGPLSTVTGAALLNAMVCGVIEMLLADGVIPPVFMSANLDGGDEHNRVILSEYKDNIYFMK